jgi:hypothetical protein
VKVEAALARPALTAEPSEGPADRDLDRTDHLLGVVTLLGCVLLVVLALGRSLLGLTVFAGTDVLYESAPWSAQVDPRFQPQNPYVVDPVDSVFPAAGEIADRLRAGDFAEWSSLQSGGHEQGATPNVGPLSPTTLPSFVLPLWLAPGYQKLLDLVVAIGGTYLFARRLGLARSAGLIGGLAFATSGFLVVWTNWPQARVAALIPALFWALERLVQERNARGVALLAVVTAAMVLSGFPSIAAYAFLTAVPYVLMRVVVVDRASPKRALGGIALAAAGVGLGGLLSAIQMLPFVRQLGQVSLGDRLQTPEDFETLGSLVTMLMPTAYGTAGSGWDGPRNPIESISYAGVAVVLLAVVGVLAGLGQRRLRWVVAVLVAMAVFWGVAMYAGGPLLTALQELPLFATNRIGRARSVLGFLVAMLAAIGVDALVRSPRSSPASMPRRVAVGLGWAAAAAALVGLVDHGLGVAREQGVDEAYYRDQVVTAGLLLVGAVVAVLVARWAPRGWRMVGLIALPVLVLGQALWFALPFWPEVSRADFYPETATHEFLAESLDHDRFVSTEGAMLPGSSVAYGLRALNGHAFIRAEFADLLRAVDPDGFVAATLVAPHLPEVVEARHLLDRLGVRYVVAPPDAENPGLRTVVGLASGQVAWQPDATVTVEIPAGPVRAIGVGLAEQMAHPAIQLEVRVLDQAGTQVLRGTRWIRAGQPAGDVLVALPGESLDASAEPLRAEVTLRGGHPVDVIASADRVSDPRVVVVRPADDGLRLIRAGEATVYERTGALERIRWAGTSVVEPDAARTIAMLRAGVPADVVLAEPGPSDQPSTAALDVVEDSGDTIRVEVDADAPGYLVVADALSGAFSASVDGQSTELRVADHGYVAVAVGAGSHEVALAYRQPYGGLGVAISAGAALIAIGLVALRPARERWRRRVPRTAPR